MKQALDHPNLISLAAGFTDSESLPVDATRRLVNELLDQPKIAKSALQYGSSLGDPVLRDLTARRMSQADSSAAGQRVEVPVSNLIITHGSQQFLYLLTEALIDPGDIVIVEDPTYFVYLGVLKAHGADCRGVPLKDDGIDLRRLEQTLEELKTSGRINKLKLLYLVTYFQNPTATTTSLEKKRAALDLLRHYEKAAGHPIYLVEDAAYREMRFSGRDIPSALTLENHSDRVVYTSTFSKPFATGLRLGYGWAPDPLLSTVVRLKGNHDFGATNFVQQILRQALASDVYDVHLPRMRTRYHKKARRMERALDKHFPNVVKRKNPEGGMYYWAQAPRKLRTGMKSSFFKQALESDVLYVPGELCYADDPTRKKPSHEMRLSFGAASESAIEEGIARLGRALTNAL